MKHKIIYACVSAALAVAPAFAFAQSNGNQPKDKKTIININRLDVIYPDEEYTGLFIDQKAPKPEDKNVIYEAPRVLQPPKMKESDGEAKVIFPIVVEDEGAESEDEILMAMGDSTLIHDRKLNLATWKGDTLLLVDPRKKQDFCFPTPDISRLTSRWGARKRRWHYGVDLAMPTGEPIYAAFDGVVRYSNGPYCGGYGNLIVVQHQNGLETYYAHLSKRNVHAGDHVKAGQVIGLCGNTGRSYGSHLHFEIRYKGVAMNPENVVDMTTRKLKNDQLVLNQQSFAKRGGSSSVASSGGGTYQSGGATYYKVREGDTLSKIAKRHGTTVKRLCQLNGIKETTILSIGRRLRVR